MKNRKQAHTLLIVTLTIFASAYGMDEQKQSDKKIRQQLSSPPKKTIRGTPRKKIPVLTAQEKSTIVPSPTSTSILDLDENSSSRDIAKYLEQSIHTTEALIKTLQNQTSADPTHIAQLISTRSLKKSILTAAQQNIILREPRQRSVNPKELAELKIIFIHSIINIAKLLNPKGQAQLTLDDNDRIAIIKLKDHPFLLHHQSDLKELSLQLKNWNEFQQAYEFIYSIVPEFPLLDPSHPQKIVNDPIPLSESVPTNGPGQAVSALEGQQPNQVTPPAVITKQISEPQEKKLELLQVPDSTTATTQPAIQLQPQEKEQIPTMESSPANPLRVWLKQQYDKLYDFYNLAPSFGDIMWWIVRKMFNIPSAEKERQDRGREHDAQRMRRRI